MPFAGIVGVEIKIRPIPASWFVDRERYPYKKSWRWHFVRAFDFFLDRFSKRFQKIPFPNPVRNILVVRLDQIGDLVCSLPVFQALKTKFPNAKITALVGEEGKAILDQNPFVDRLIVFHSNWFSKKKWRNPRNPFEFFQILAMLRKQKYDLGFDPRGDLRNITMMTLAGVRFRVGYGIAGGAGLLHYMPVYDQELHQVELNLRLVSDKMISRKNVKPEIYLTAKEKEEAFQKLKTLGAQKGMRLIAVHPEAGYPSKEWEECQFKELIQKLLKDPQNQILIFGLSRARRISDFFSSSNQVVNLVGAVSLREMIAMISQCHLFIGNDSGPSHIAQALGIPAVVIASGTNEYEKWGIWTEPSKVLKHEVPCSPCHLRDCNVEGHPCMSQISADQVSEAMQELVSEVA